MEKHKFTVTAGIVVGIFVVLLGICNLGVPVLLIVLGILRWEGVASFIGMCVLALVALVIFGLPTILLLNVAWDYIKVDGTQFLVRNGLRNKYTVTCADLKKVYCYKEKSSKGLVIYYMSITFEGKETFNIPYRQKNFKRLAKYFYEMHDAGVISEKVIHPREKKMLLQYSRGEFNPGEKMKFENREGGTYATYIRVTEIRDKAFLKILSPLLIWLVIVFTCLILVARMPTKYSGITVPALLISFLLIIPLVIIMCKKAAKFTADTKFINKSVVFDVIQDRVYMDGKEVKISVNSVSGLFNINTSKLEGYIVEGSNTEEFRAFLDTNEIPYDEFGEKGGII